MAHHAPTPEPHRTLKKIAALDAAAAVRTRRAAPLRESGGKTSKMKGQGRKGGPTSGDRAASDAPKRPVMVHNPKGGAPRGNRNAQTHGRHAREARTIHAEIRRFLAGDRAALVLAELEIARLRAEKAASVAPGRAPYSAHGHSQDRPHGPSRSRPPGRSGA